MEMRERIARALMREAGDDPDADSWCSPNAWYGAADAVLAAMREPTDQMIMAGIIERHDAGTPEAWKLATAHIYTAMIDAARAPCS